MGCTMCLPVDTEGALARESSSTSWRWHCVVVLDVRYAYGLGRPVIVTSCRRLCAGCPLIGIASEKHMKKLPSNIYADVAKVFIYYLFLIVNVTKSHMLNVLVFR